MFLCDMGGNRKISLWRTPADAFGRLTPLFCDFLAVEKLTAWINYVFRSSRS